VGRDTPVFKLVQDTTATVVDDPEAMSVDLDELCRVAAQEMLDMALLAERRAYLEAHGAELDAASHHLVVANGYARARKVTRGARMVEVQAPRVDDRREGERFSSAVLPAYRQGDRGDRGAAHLVPGRAVHRGLRPGGAGSCKAGLAMAYTLLDAAEARGAESTATSCSFPWCEPEPLSSTASYKKGVTSPSKPRRTKGPSVPA
jgi:hypothetical protein